MPAILEIPTAVAEVMAKFEDLFANRCQREHFAEYLTGLMVARRKTINGMSGEFPASTDQSCWNRFLTASDWDPQAINERRLELLQEDSATRYHQHGVIALDNVLIDHDGQLIEDAGWFWDHAEERHKIAHDYLFANYVCSSGKHYPLEFHRFKKREQCEATGQAFQNHGVLFRRLIDWVVAHDIPGDFAFDCYFTNAENMNHIHGKTDRDGRSRGYVGDLKTNRKVWYRGREMRADELAASIEPAARKAVRRGEGRQWYFTCTLRMPGVNHPLRIVILWNQRRDARPCKILITNRTTWEIMRILGVYRRRWTGTETFHRDGKQELGLGDCQLRDGQGQTRHMYLVMTAYSLLVRQIRQRRAREWTLHKLTTIGEACRAVLAETLRATLHWAIRRATENPNKPSQITDLLGLT
jgi:hypothetical protein